MKAESKKEPTDRMRAAGAEIISSLNKIPFPIKTADWFGDELYLTYRPPFVEPYPAEFIEKLKSVALENVRPKIKCVILPDYALNKCTDEERKSDQDKFHNWLDELFWKKYDESKIAELEKTKIMPITKKGKKIMKAMKDEYGKEKGEKIFYASKNKGKIKGVEGKKKGHKK